MQITEFNGMQIQDAFSQLGYVPKKELRILDLMWMGDLFRQCTINTDYMIDTIRQDSINVQYNPEMIWSDFHNYAKQFDGKSNFSQVDPTTPLPESITTDKGLSITLQRYDSSSPVIEYTPRQINAREVMVDNVVKGQSSDVFAGIPERTIDTKLYAPTARQLDMFLLKSLGRSYPLTAGKTYFNQDGSEITSIGIANRMNSNEDRSNYMSGDKIQKVRQYKRNVLIGHHKEGVITLHCPANDADALWAELMVKRGWGTNTDYNSFNSKVSELIHQRVKMPEDKLSELESEYGIKIKLIPQTTYEDVGELLYKDTALSSNVDDVNVYYQKQFDNQYTPTLQTYQATNNYISKSYFVIDTMNNSGLMEIYPVNFIGFEEYNAARNPSFTNYKQEKLFMGLSLAKQWTEAGFLKGVHGPSHKAHLMSSFFHARVETRNVIEVHSKRTDILPLGVNTNTSRTPQVDAFALDVNK